MSKLISHSITPVPYRVVRIYMNNDYSLHVNDRNIKAEQFMCSIFVCSRLCFSVKSKLLNSDIMRSPSDESKEVRGHRKINLP